MPTSDLCIPADEFIRMFSLRGPQLMWLLGAGASASSGVKTAHHMIWEFKRAIYCSQQRVAISSCSDLSDPILQQRIQAFFDSKGDYPHNDSDDEYGRYFEAAWPNEGDRQRYIHQLVENASPSYGSLVVAALMKLGKIRHVWTTNFDSVVEDAVSQVFRSARALTVVSLESAELAMQTLASGHAPILVKLHGDFRSRRLKNTAAELQQQNSQLHAAFLHALKLSGLVVAGYSGRDQSLMDTITDAIHNGGLQGGMFWFYRPSAGVSRGVLTLIEGARHRGIDAHLVASETFDELMADLACTFSDIPGDIQKIFDGKPRQLTPAVIPPTTGTFPVLRFNAYPILQYPTVCRRVECKIGGASAVRAAVAASGHQILAGRRSVGVIAFGEDADVRTCFAAHDVGTFDLHSIEFRRLRYDSGEHGLLTEAAWRALGRERPVLPEARGRSRWLTVDPTRLALPECREMRKAFPIPHGTVPRTSVPWREAVKLRLVGVGDNLWLVLEPAIWFDLRDCSEGSDGLPKPPPEALDFARDKAANRYNKMWNALFDSWATLLFGDEPSIALRALGCQAGVDAEFRFGRTSAFSRRGTWT